jgi:hypothetical protein
MDAIELKDGSVTVPTSEEIGLIGNFNGFKLIRALIC